MPNDWTSKQIQLELEKAGTPRLVAVDRAHGLPEGTCHTAVHKPHSKGECAIATTLGIPAHRIWPSRYDRTGKRLTPQPMKNYKPNRAATHGQKRGAA